MEILKTIADTLQPGLPMIAVVILGVLLLFGIKKFLDKRYEDQTDKNMKIQLLMLVLSFVLLIVVIIVSPVHDNQKGQILSLIGIVLSAAIALSSTTFVGNALAGLMMRVVKGFRVGDFVRVGDHFGRVSERGLFHIEIQTEERDLTTLPNLLLVTNPVKVIRSSGTIVWAEVSLGYDVPRTRIKEVLLRAAEKCELQEPFVHVMQLGDFSVVYRVAGLLPEVKQLLSTRSRIRECVLDELHTAGIEIVSPTFMNTRQISPDVRFISKVARESMLAKHEPMPEDIVFDKAEEAESMEQLRKRFEAMGGEIKELKESLRKTEDAKKRAEIESRVARLDRSREALNARLELAQEEKKSENGK
jgi:small conductance mechanosensitive channel